ncbi:hypothetical protein [Burkholderia pyrrocinia]|uniref:hypothetical protein n=1 Tax=Burkholderia pyrrocinia TaxID=60550 RepID=UPI0012601DA3|nr:hypothetical protein [Burkholderia pyrrocinia]
MGESVSMTTFARHYIGRFDDDTGISLSTRDETLSEFPLTFDENCRRGRLREIDACTMQKRHHRFAFSDPGPTALNSADCCSHDVKSRYVRLRRKHSPDCTINRSGGPDQGSTARQCVLPRAPFAGRLHSNLSGIRPCIIETVLNSIGVVSPRYCPFIRSGSASGNE